MAKVGGTDVERDGEDVHQPTWSYATKKTLAKGLLNASLLISNCAQLKALFAVSDQHRDGFWIAQLTLVFLSIALQIVVSLLLLVLGFYRPTQKHHVEKCERLNNAAVVIVLLITIVNIVIASFGMQLTNSTL